MTRYVHLPVWKDSTLPLLFYGLDEQAAADIGVADLRADGQRIIVERARRVNVWLQRASGVVGERLMQRMEC